MKRNFYLSLISSLLIMLGCGLFWFKDISVPIIDPDEVVWVLDARFYNFRQQKKWEKFELIENPMSLGWSHDQFRLIDQPQLGKYIYGLIISLSNFDPWEEKQSLFLYEQFANMRLDVSSIKTDEKYSEIMNSINLLRVFGSIASFIAITIFSVVVFLLTKSRVVGGLTSIFLFFHPTLYHWYRLVVPNSFQTLFIIAAVSLIFYLLNNIKDLGLKKKVLWLLVGSLVAASTSIKLNGFFILAIPIFVWLVQEIKASFSQQEVLIDLANKVKAYFILLIGFSTTFYFLEPELWNHPILGLKLLFGTRLDQHQRFLSFFKNYNFFETIWFLLVQFLRISDFWIIKLLLLFFLVLGIKKIIDKLPNYYWLNLGLLIIFMVIFNIFYANVGFIRYAEWSIYIFSFLSALGMVEFLKIIHRKAKQLYTVSCVPADFSVLRLKKSGVRNMKKIVIIFLASIFLTGCSKSEQLITAQVGDSKKLQLEVVSTPQRIEQGLSGREEIGADGMLFIFGQPRMPQFWMKEMKFDLDMVWVKDMLVVEITESVPAPDLNTPLNQLSTYAPRQPVDMVLEVEAGKTKEWGLVVGDEVLIN